MCVFVCGQVSESMIASMTKVERKVCDTVYCSVLQCVAVCCSASIYDYINDEG